MSPMHVLFRYNNVVPTSVGSVEFATYSQYHAELRDALAEVLAGTISDPLSFAKHLDGLAYQRLRQAVPVEARRSSSTFFTSSSLRARLVAPYRELVARDTLVLDPTCGAGDLLIAALELLPDSWTAARIRRHVASHFCGRELIPVLAAVARDRLQLAVSMASPSRGKVEAFSTPKIQAGDGLGADVPYASARLVLLNPPYGRKILSQPTHWAEGLTSQAAPFTIHVLENCRNNTRVAAILPDVLRSGSRYRKWRDEVEKLAIIDELEVVGLFDSWTDIDVFIAHLRVRPRRRSPVSADASFDWHSMIPPTQRDISLGDIASVSIGDVVPHRHKEEGPEVPYLTVHSTPIGETITTAPKRKFVGRLHKAPFIVIRRTSAPTRAGGARIASSIVHSTLGSVAVENHLIVVKPNASTLSACRRLRKQLGDPAVTAWLDKRLRTRHLTKEALLELPLPNDDRSGIGLIQL
jgi:N-6 DNA Methylase